MAAFGGQTPTIIVLKEGAFMTPRHIRRQEEARNANTL